MLSRRALSITLMLLGAVSLCGRAEAENLCVVGNSNYTLQIGAGIPIVGAQQIFVTGSREVGGISRPVVGTLTVDGSTVRISLTEMLGTGAIPSEPMAITFLTFPPAPGTPSYDTTYVGLGMPRNVGGNLGIIACPTSTTNNAAPERKQP